MRGVLDGAAATGARIVYADNLYAYGPVDGLLTEELPSRASGPNGRVRATLADQLLEADARGTVRATIGRASDYYGPRGRRSTSGERLFVPAMKGKVTQVLGDPNLPHTLTNLRDFARGLVILGTNDAALGQVWHVLGDAERWVRPLGRVDRIVEPGRRVEDRRHMKHWNDRCQCMSVSACIIV
jgi:nucleoside-diphosphate-sugar epimerase